jgi:hypothetical protein
MFATLTHWVMAEAVRVKITLLPSLHGADPVVASQVCHPEADDHPVVDCRSAFDRNSAADTVWVPTNWGITNADTITRAVAQTALIRRCVEITDWLLSCSESDLPCD